MTRWWFAAPLLAALLGCPKPSPKPPEPPPPTPSPTTCELPCKEGERCVVMESMPVQYVCEPIPEPTPNPTPIACTVDLTGTPALKTYMLYPRVADSTPLIINADRCRAIGYGDRVACPVVRDEDPQRLVCEQALMGGPAPLYELVVDSGGLRWWYDDEEHPWKARIGGEGKGRLRGCYPNGKVCSDWIELVLQ